MEVFYSECIIEFFCNCCQGIIAPRPSCSCCSGAVCCNSSSGRFKLETDSVFCFQQRAKVHQEALARDLSNAVLKLDAIVQGFTENIDFKALQDKACVPTTSSLAGQQTLCASSWHIHSGTTPSLQSGVSENHGGQPKALHHYSVQV